MGREKYFIACYLLGVIGRGMNYFRRAGQEKLNWIGKLIDCVLKIVFG